MFEIVTALTISVISVILVLYFIVLKRKGWLREDSKETFYRCPNQECRKIFQKPIILTDLSHNPPRVYSACPHCGFDLLIGSSSAVGKEIDMAFKIPQRPEESKVIVETSNPEMSIESTEISEKPTVAEDVRKIQTASKKPPQGRPHACSHFLGYLRKVPKNSSIPDECFSCPKMVECLSHIVSD
jgi:hypothetical protein